MDKTWITRLTVVATGLLAIGVCSVGMMKENNKKVKNNPTFDKLAIRQEIDKVPKIQAEVTAMHNQDNQVYLKVGLTNEMVNQTLHEVQGIKTSKESFHINCGRVPKAFSQLKESKQHLLAEMKKVKEQYQLQTAIQQLFSGVELDWLTANTDVVLKEAIPAEKMTDLQAKIAALSPTEWQAAAQKYLERATIQNDQIQKVSQLVATCLTGDTLTANATYATYLDLVNQVTLIKNPETREQYRQKSKQIWQLMNEETTSQTPATAEVAATTQQIVGDSANVTAATADESAVVQ